MRAEPRGGQIQGQRAAVAADPRRLSPVLAGVGRLVHTRRRRKVHGVAVRRIDDDLVDVLADEGVGIAGVGGWVAGAELDPAGPSVGGLEEPCSWLADSARLGADVARTGPDVDRGRVVRVDGDGVRFPDAENRLLVEDRGPVQTTVDTAPHPSHGSAQIDHVGVVGIDRYRGHHPVVVDRFLHRAGADRDPNVPLEGHARSSSPASGLVPPTGTSDPGPIPVPGLTTAPGRALHCRRARAYRSAVGGGLPSHLRAWIRACLAGSSPPSSSRSLPSGLRRAALRLGCCPLSSPRELLRSGMRFSRL